jgi:hypothetical protein
MIKEYVAELAGQMGIMLTKVTIKEKPPAGSLDAYLLEISSNGKLVSERIHKSEILLFESGQKSELLEIKVRSALMRLKMMFD